LLLRSRKQQSGNNALKCPIASRPQIILRPSLPSGESQINSPGTYEATHSSGLAAMESNNGMLRGTDVSLKQTSICVVRGTGSIVREGVVDSDPDAIAAFVRSKAPGAILVGLETGPTTTWRQQAQLSMTDLREQQTVRITFSKAPQTYWEFSFV